ncbi:hypothetical protein LCGC14_2331050, partial [marine sediment metagenome]
MGFNTTWKRLLHDFEYGLFITQTHELAIIQKDLDNWKDWITKEIKDKKYIPSPAHYCNVPKRGGLIRPGSHLTISDHFYYLHLVGEAYNKIYKKLQWSQEIKDFAYALTGKVDDPKWVKNQFLCWQSFRQKSLEKLDKGYPFIIITDITGYYENIDHMTLYSDLKAVGTENETAIAIKSCLKKWAILQGKGLPQACTASHILAKLFLNDVDLALYNSNIEHLRYVDDIRIFCKSKAEAKMALVQLIELLRLRGLNLQSAKTKIVNAEDARKVIEGVQFIINNIAERIKEKQPVKAMPKTNGIQTDSSDSLTPEQYAQLNEMKDSETVHVLIETFRAYFYDSTDDSFDKTLFHYLLNRLADANNDFALDYCVSIVEKHSEETEYILKYVTKIRAQDRVLVELIKFLSSSLSTYPFQEYQIIRWINENYTEISDELTAKIRPRMSNR